VGEGCRSWSCLRSFLHSPVTPFLLGSNIVANLQGYCKRNRHFQRYVVSNSLFLL
jgi:hypothetical protein